MRTKDELMWEIVDVYPGVESKKLRRGTMAEPEDIKPRWCMTGLQWKREDK